ncbi:MAG: protein kinase [Planctomycetes bacterium]|nr:protein kinase [Planctomycetota bacterium]
MNERDIFMAALERVTPAERRAYVAAASQGDEELRQGVEALLAAHERAGGFLAEPAVATPDPVVAGPCREGPGTVIGPYKLLEQIGEGGFGIVYMAEQTQPVRRKVALKIVKLGLDTRQVVARFEAERQALALMDHPNIARVFDAGETGTGRPYFVMELVRGVPITDFCDANPLSVRQRLELFVNVCQAVQHAHQKGIIHRDLKPTNLLITLHDGTPVVKIIDFGISKALGQQLTEKTLFTNFAQMIGTPIYMSPEQAEMSGLDIDTRSDIYSLGVLLYELLTGTTPRDKERLKTAAYDEIRRIIREEEPAKPSTRISTLGKAAPTVSANRQSDPKRLCELFKGELDWIVMKALEKDRNRRYETASAFAADVQRYLNDEQVQACPPSTLYRFGKFARRHKPALAIGAVLTLAVLVTLVTLARSNFLVTRESAQKELALQDKETAVLAAEASARKATDQLFLALLNQAQAKRVSGGLGQRFGALKAIREAAQIRVTPELRTEATAALVLPDAEIAQEWERSTDDNFGVVFDASFQRYAGIDKQGRVTVCQVSNGREEVITRLLPPDKTKFRGILLSQDGRFLACGYGATTARAAGGVRVWKLSPEPELLLDEPPGLINDISLAFHPSGRQLALGHADKFVSIYDLATGGCVQRLALSAAPFHLAFHPRELRLAVACGNAVQLFDTDTGKELPPLRHPATVTHTWSVAWHPDGRRLAAGCDDTKIHVWDTQTAVEVMSPWTGYSADGIALAFNNAGDLLSSSDWSGHRLWDTASGRALLTLPLFAAFSSDAGLIGPQHYGNKIRLWRPAGGRELRVLRPRNAGAPDIIQSPVVHPDGKVLAAYGRQQLCFFDLASGEELASVRVPSVGATFPLYFDPPHATQDRLEGKSRLNGTRPSGWVTASQSGLYLWPAREDGARPGGLRIGPPQQIASNSGSSEFNGASASADGSVVAVPQGDSTLLLSRDRTRSSLVLRPQYDVRYSAVSPDGKWVVTCSWFEPDGRSKSIRVWKADTGVPVKDLAQEGLASAKFSPDGLWLMTRTSGGTRQWEVGTWREVRRFEGGLFAFAFSPNSRLLAINDVVNVIRLLETTTGREVARLTGPDLTWYYPACFTPDGTRLIATAEKALYVWDLRLIRRQLKDLALDWDWPEFPPAEPGAYAAKPRPVEVFAGDLAETVLTREERYRRAIEQYRRDAEAEPNNPNACNNLAWTYLTAPEPLRNVKAALPLAENAVRLAAGNANFRNTLGLANYRAGRFREAVKALEPNLYKQNDEFLIFDLYFLAMSHHRLGESTRARDYLAWAVRWGTAERGKQSGR